MSAPNQAMKIFRTKGTPVILSLELLMGCQRGGGATPVPYAVARAVIDRHCVSCHSDRPTLPAFPIAPNGVELDTPGQMRRHAQRIKVRTMDKTMPLLNKTGMTDGERDIIKRWVDTGAGL